MAWGGLNPALTAWREGINKRFPGRGTRSDGGYADKLHGSNSQHQPDADGTVDAFDADVNFFGSKVETGTATERRIAAALCADFQADRRAQLWIYQRQIANVDIGPWRVRPYTGPSPHDHHLHFQSRQAHERDGSPWRYTHTDALLRELNGDDMALTVDDKNWITGLVRAEVAKLPAMVWAYQLEDPASTTTPKAKKSAGAYQRWNDLVNNASAGKVVAALTPLITARQGVGAGELAAALTGPLTAAIVAALPEDRDDITPEELRQALRGVALDLLTGKADHE